MAIANEEFVIDVFYQKCISFYFFTFISSLHCLQILCNMHLFYIHCKSDRAFLSLELIKFRIKDKVGAKCSPFNINWNTWFQALVSIFNGVIPFTIYVVCCLSVYIIPYLYRYLSKLFWRLKNAIHVKIKILRTTLYHIHMSWYNV